MVTSANGSQSTLNQYDISAASLIPIKALTIGANPIVVNAIGYSNTQNVFWAVRALKNPPPAPPPYYPDEIVRIDSKGNVDSIGAPGNLAALGHTDFLALAGAVQGDKMYVHTKVPANHLFEIDVKIGSPTLGNILNDIPLSRITPGNADAMLNLGDWDYNDTDGQLYGVELTSTSRKIVKVAIGSGTVTDVADVSADIPDSDNFGAVFVEDGTANLYTSANNIQVNNVNSGESQTFMVRLDLQPPLVQKFAKGAALKINDGGDCLLASDFGDAPDTYKTKDVSGGAAHVMSTVFDSAAKFYMGASVDSDIDGFPGAGADTDDTNVPQTNDEDAIPAGTKLDGDKPTITVPVVNTLGGSYTLAGWLDTDNSGTFSASERVKSSTGTLTWPKVARSLARAGDTMLRLRLYSGAVADPQPGGWVDNGEVEDHKVTITPPDDVQPTPGPDPTNPPNGGGDPDPNTDPDPASDAGGPDDPQLASTGTRVRPFVVLGGGMLGFGGLVLGLAWVLGRRSPNE